MECFCSISRGMKTLMSESYTMPPERKRWELFTLNVPKPWHAPLESKELNFFVVHIITNFLVFVYLFVYLPLCFWSCCCCFFKGRAHECKTLVSHLFFIIFSGPGPGETFRVPRMYNTEYQFYGSEKPVTVWGNIMHF